MKPHKHAEIIKAWADGATVQSWTTSVSEWEDNSCPLWLEEVKYRIKPEPMTDVFHYYNVSSAQGFVYISGHKDKQYQTTPHNLKLTFDGETGKLKAAEVIS